MRRTPGAIARNDGDAVKALAGAAKVIEATYTFPYLAHAPLEPNDCVIYRTADGGAELMFGSQLQTVDQAVAAGVLGLKPEQVKIKTLLAGGSFGRRATPAGDMAAEAAEVLKGAKHKGPIKVMWTREDDIKGGRYRPVFVHKLRGGLDAAGNIVAWDQVIVGQSFMKGSPFESAMMKDGVDQTMVEGASTLPYHVPNLRVSAHIVETGVSTLWWRSVGLDAHGLRDRGVPRSARRGGGHRSAGDPAEAADQPPAPPQRAQHRGQDGQVGRAASRRQGARHRGARILQVVRRACRRGVDRRGRSAEGRAGRSARPIAASRSIPTSSRPSSRAAWATAFPRRCSAPSIWRAGASRNRIFTITAYCASMRCRTSRCTSCRRRRSRPASASRACRRSRPAVANAWAKLTGQRLFDLPFSRSAAKV